MYHVGLYNIDMDTLIPENYGRPAEVLKNFRPGSVN